MRYLILSNNAGVAGQGDDYEALVAGAIPFPGASPLANGGVIPTTAQVDPGVRNVDHDEDVRNNRGTILPLSFAAQPRITFSAKAWTGLLRRIIPKAMNGDAAAYVSSGVAPAAVETVVTPARYGGLLLPLSALLVREDQVDMLTGIWLDSFTIDFPTEGEGTIEVEGQALWHTIESEAEAIARGLVHPTSINPTTQQTQAYMLRGMTAFLGAVPTEIDCLSGFGMTYNNSLSDEIRRTHCAGHNVVEYVKDGDSYGLWYPKRHAVGERLVTGRLDFGTTRPDREQRRIIAAAEKLVVEVEALGTMNAVVPAAKRMLRFIFHKHAYTGGGAEPLQRGGDQFSSYEFAAGVNVADGKDFEFATVDSAATTPAL